MRNFKSMRKLNIILYSIATIHIFIIVPLLKVLFYDTFGTYSLQEMAIPGLAILIISLIIELMLPPKSKNDEKK